MTLSEQLAGWASALRLDDVPERVQVIARSLVLSQLAAARATLDHELGAKVVRAFGSPLQADPKRSAYSLAALTVALDFDDTVYAGHVTHTAVNVALAYARSLRLEGSAALAAAIAAIECAARVTAAATLGPLRGQTAAHTHLAGAVAARLHAERAPARQWVNALGLAFAAPPRPLMRAFLGSEAKLLIAAAPLGIGLDACDAAAAGFSGASDILEHPDGFLAGCAAVPLPDALVSGLGERWHTETASLKVHPGSAYLSSAIDCAIELHHTLDVSDPGDVSEVIVEASLFTTEMDRRSAPYLEGPRSSPIALNFSVAYNVATALLTGALTPHELSRERVREEPRWRLAEKVQVKHDPQLTLRALGATAPIGQALREAGERAAPWLRAEGGDAAAALAGQIGPPADTFAGADKAIGARVSVRLADGREASASREIAAGAAGGETRGCHFELMREKFLAAGGSTEVLGALARIEELDGAALGRALSAALSH